MAWRPKANEYEAFVSTPTFHRLAPVVLLAALTAAGAPMPKALDGGATAQQVKPSVGPGGHSHVAFGAVPTAKALVSR